MSQQVSATNNVSGGGAAATAQQAASSISANVQRGKRGETQEEWLRRIARNQMSGISPQQREEMTNRANAAQRQMQQARQFEGCKRRNVAAKTSAYNALDSSAVSRGALQERVSLALRSAAGGGSAASAEQRAQVQMEMMDADDVAIQQAFAAPAAASPAAGIVALSNDDDMFHAHSGDGLAVVPDAATNAVTDDEERQALRQLETEPNNDDDRAARFAIFERFSNRVAQIRSDLDRELRTTVAELPQRPAQDIQRMMQNLDSAQNQGIQDNQFQDDHPQEDDEPVVHLRGIGPGHGHAQRERRVAPRRPAPQRWFVYDMWVVVARNSAQMGDISGEIARKVRMIAQNTQTECPVCLAPFDVTNPNDPNETGAVGLAGGAPTGDELPVTPVTLSCLHRVCSGCLEQMTRIRGPHIACPLCRADVFMDFVAPHYVDEPAVRPDVLRCGTGGGRPAPVDDESDAPGPGLPYTPVETLQAHHVHLPAPRDYQRMG